MLALLALVGYTVLLTQTMDTESYNTWGALFMVPVIVGLNLVLLNTVRRGKDQWITGVVIVEVVFVYPGLGQLMVDSVSNRDMPVVQACALIFAAVYILLNLLADVLAIATNPRLLHPR